METAYLYVNVQALRFGQSDANTFSNYLALSGPLSAVIPCYLVLLPGPV